MIKTKPEFRVYALRLAKKEGFETTHFCGIYKDFEVYTAGHKVPCVIGLPQVILANEVTVKFDNTGDPFKILDACRKLPKVIFEYDCMSFFEGSYKLILLDDGRLIREDNIFEDLIINSSELVKAIKKLIKENKEELEKLPKEISNSHILDGAGETFRFGRLKVEGSNILTVSMEGYEEALKKYNAVEMGWEKDLLHFQRIFKKFQDKFHEYVAEPLFNGEDIEEEEE